MRKCLLVQLSWIKEALKLAGIDESIFKGHSKGAASSSKPSKAEFNIRSSFDFAQKNQITLQPLRPRM